MTRIAILDYGMGNLRSVGKALEHVGAEPFLTSSHARVRGAAAIVLPGVGAMPKAMERVTELAEEFFRAVANTAKLTLHVRVETGTNTHHMVEASFKAFARALRTAVEDDDRVEGVPSTKGIL